MCNGSTFTQTDFVKETTKTKKNWLLCVIFYVIWLQSPCKCITVRLTVHLIGETDAFKCTYNLLPFGLTLTQILTFKIVIEILSVTGCYEYVGYSTIFIPCFGDFPIPVQTHCLPADIVSVIMVRTVTCNLCKTGSADAFEMSVTLCVNVKHIIFVDVSHTLWNHFLSVMSFSLSNLSLLPTPVYKANIEVANNTV